MSDHNRHYADRENGFVRKAYVSKGDDATFSRFVKVPGEARKPKHKQHVFNGIGHPTVEAGRSLFFRKGVKRVDEVTNVLVSGHNNVKIGRDVRKGEFRGYWIYTLSLEERATCPRTCVHWYDCYGNHMPYAKRIQHGEGLEAAIERDIVRLLGVRGRVGIMIRLHALGDFYSVAYVRFWTKMLRKYQRLAVYGYTARQPDTAIGYEVKLARKRYGKRFAVRLSEGQRPSIRRAVTPSFAPNSED